MRGPKPKAVALSEKEREELEGLVHRHKTPQHLALRGHILLLAAEGMNTGQIAREMGVSVETARTWRMRWLGLQCIAAEDLSVSERLADIPRPGRPAHITGEHVCQIMALACEQPKDRPISQWTGREIADEVMARGIIDHISPRHASRLLKKGISNRI